MTQACSRISGPTVRLYLADRWRGMVLLSGLSLVLMLGCGFTPTRALGMPGAASRAPDLSLPLQAADRNLALLYLDKKHPPRGQWEHWSKEAIKFRMEQMGLSRKDLEPYIGKRGRGAAVMSNGSRPTKRQGRPGSSRVS